MALPELRADASCASAHSVPNLRYDVVVVGAGLAGTVASLRARERGREVLLIEKACEVPQGGNSMMSGGGFHVGFEPLTDDPIAISERVQIETDGRASPRLVEAFAGHCAPSMRWLSAKGFSLERFPGGATDFLTPFRRHDSAHDWAGSGIATALEMLQCEFIAAGGTLVRDARALEVVPAKHRGVAGVVIEDRAGLKKVAAAETILADGGFQANASLLHTHVGRFADQALLRGGRGDTGDGLRMALRVGAKVVGLPYVYGHLLHREALDNSRLWPYPLLDGLITGFGLLVNRHGTRFTDEGHGGVAATNALVRGADPCGSWIVIGEQEFQDAGSQAPFGIPLPVPSPALRERGATIVRAEDPSELATAIGASDESLVNTIARYNDAVDRGRAAFLPQPNTNAICRRVEPPLLGIPVVPGITFTMGGPLIDEYARIIDVDERPIRGLRAAGSASGGLQGGPRGGYIGGLAPALVLGHLAGELRSPRTGGNQ